MTRSCEARWARQWEVECDPRNHAVSHRGQWSRPPRLGHSFGSDALAGVSDRRRLVPRSTARLLTGLLPLLVRLVRLARERSAAESLPAIPDRHRRAWDPF